MDDFIINGYYLHDFDKDIIQLLEVNERQLATIRVVKTDDVHWKGQAGRIVKDIPIYHLVGYIHLPGYDSPLFKALNK